MWIINYELRYREREREELIYRRKPHQKAWIDIFDGEGTQDRLLLCVLIL